MMVTVNYEDKIRAAYKRGATDALLHAKGLGPKPSVDDYMAELAKKPVVARL